MSYNDYRRYRSDSDESISSSRMSRFQRWFGVVLSPFRRMFSNVDSPKAFFVLLLKIGLWSGVGLGIIIVVYLAHLWFTLPDISDPRSFLASQSTVVTDRHGTELYRFFSEEDRTLVQGNLIPQHMKHAIISIEDERYYDRGCLDIRAIARAVFRLGKAGGASTLTRQLARNALDLKNENIYNRKLKELALGCQMESEYTKDELLELYLNWIPFGQNAYGIEQASQEYFSTSASGLTLAQSAVLASLPQRPTYFSPYGSHRNTQVSEKAEEAVINGTITRASQIADAEVTIGLIGSTIGTGATTVYIGGRTDQVLANMQDQGFVTEQERLAALSELETIEFQPTRETIRAPHFVLWVRDQLSELLAGAEEGILERGGLTIETTLDWELQQLAEQSIEFHQEDILDRFGAYNISLLSLHPETREILVYVGNTDYNDEENAGKVDMVQAPRQPGSSFKPFVYASAFEKGYSPATVLFDVPTKIGDNEPQNFDGEFLGPLTIRQSLGASRNIPAAKGFFLGGGENTILQLVSSMGAPSPLQRRTELTRQRGEPFEYGWPLALGAAETPLLEMVQAYSTFADEGTYVPAVSIRRITDKNGSILYQSEFDAPGEEVLDPRIAYQITSVLSDESARPDEYWRSQLTVPGYQTAAKTGTSNKCLEWKDENTCLLRKPDNAWLVGYTPELVTGVWVGNADNAAMFDKAGGLNTASPIWRDYMVQAHRTMETSRSSFDVPADIVQPQVSLLSGQLATECTPVELRKADVFLKENAPTLPDPACAQLTIDKVTGLLASDECPEDAQEDGSFFVAHSILPERWPTWEEGVLDWMAEQMELWNATENHSGSLLKLPQAPEEICDPELTPGRLIEPEVSFKNPIEGGIASYPAFVADIDFEVGSSVQEVRMELDGRRVAVMNEPPFKTTIRVPRSVKQGGVHQLTVILEDEYFNKVEETINIRFGEDKEPPRVRFTKPRNTSYEVGDTITMEAEASDKEGGIKYVQFYLNDVLLSTKPKEPFALTYELDVPEGVHTLRAVAEDMAKQTNEDTMEIAVGDVGYILLPPPIVDTDPEEEEGGAEPISPPVPEGDDPYILVPSNNLSLQKDEIVKFTVHIPTFDSNDYRSLRLVVRDLSSQIDDVLLHLREGGGDYKRDWKGKQKGAYELLVISEEHSGAETIWDTREIEVQ